MSRSKPVSPELAEQRIALLEKHFFTRIDMIAAKMVWGKPHPVEGGAHLRALLTAHVMGESAPRAVVRYTNRRGDTKVEKGHFRLGSYTPDAKGMTRWLCLDFDANDHADGLRDPDLAIRRTHAVFQSLGIPSYIERSGGGKGWHLWVFFSEPVSAKDVRKLAHMTAPRDLPLVSGRLVDARVNRGIEVFPKQDKAKKKRGFGNLVWLPFWSGAPGSANTFYAEEADKLHPFEPEAFDTVCPAQLAGSLARLEEAEATEARNDVGNAGDPSRAVADDQAVESFLKRVDKDEAAAPPPSDDWRRWREEAQAQLPLEQIYGDLLTGEYSGENWLRCQDPDSPSGPDSRSGSVADGKGEAPRGTFHSFRTEETMSVFDFMVLRGMATDFRDALRKVAEMTGVSLPQSAPPTGPPGSPPATTNGYPIIVVNGRQLRDILWDTWQIVHAANARNTFLFRRSGRLVRLAMAGGSPQMEFIDDTVMYGTLARLGDWIRRTEDGEFDVMPPHDVAKDLVASPDPRLPPLDAIVTAPVFDQDKKLAATPGYHLDAALWYHKPNDFEVPPVSENPSGDEVEHAKALLIDELLVDFPFVAQADRAHAIAALLLPFVRRLIPGPTPVHLFEAPMPGSGKTLMAEIVYLVASGDSADPMTLGKDDEETRKKITSVLSLGRSVILIDNVRAGIDSANLAAALTAETWQDRLLGQNKMVRIPNRAVWLLTANNPHLTLEIARRSIRIRIEPRSDRPWERDNFRHTPLKPWVIENRGVLVWSILTLIQAWIAGGAPRGPRTLGSFEHWANIIGGILEEVGIGGFLGNTEELYESADLEGQEWREFVQAWWDEHGSTPVATKFLLNLAQDKELLGLTIGSKSERSQATRLGKALASNRNRRFAHHRIEAARVSHNQRLWRVVEVADDTNDDINADAGETEKGGLLLPFERNVPPYVPLRKPAETLDAGDMGDMGDINPTLAHVIGCERTHSAHTCTRTTPENVPHVPHVPQTQQNQGDAEGDIEEQRPPMSPSTSPDSLVVDLAHLDDEEDDA